MELITVWWLTAVFDFIAAVVFAFLIFQAAEDEEYRCAIFFGAMAIGLGGASYGAILQLVEVYK